MSSTTTNQEDNDERINNSSCNRNYIRSTDARSDVLSNPRTTDGDAMKQQHEPNQQWPSGHYVRLADGGIAWSADILYDGLIIDNLTTLAQDVLEKRLKQLEEEPEDEMERRTR